MKPKIKLGADAYYKIMTWVEGFDSEISGVGEVKLLDDNTFLIDDVSPSETTDNTAGSTELTAEGLAKAMFENIKNGKTNTKFWWHSHASMGVFWSQTDHQAMIDMSGGGWIVSIVFNKKREMLGAFYDPKGTKTPFGYAPLFMDNLEIDIEWPVSEIQKTAWLEEMRAKVKVKTYTPYSHYVSEWEAGRNAQAGYHPSGRPFGLSKKEWKRQRKNVSGIVQANKYFDEYGYSHIERQWLSELGFDVRDIDYLKNGGLTPAEILKLADIGVSMEEIAIYISQNPKNTFKEMSDFFVEEDKLFNAQEDDLTPGQTLHDQSTRQYYNQDDYMGAM